MEAEPTGPIQADWDAAHDYLTSGLDPNLRDAAYAFMMHRRSTQSALMNLAHQYLSDLRRPPTGDSLRRRIDHAEKVIAMTIGRL